jgi:hypothetical protein
VPDGGTLVWVIPWGRTFPSDAITTKDWSFGFEAATTRTVSSEMGFCVMDPPDPDRETCFFCVAFVM